MSWTSPTGHVYAVGEVVTAAVLNTYVKDNLIDLDRRTTVVTAAVATLQTTTSDVFADLATTGPTITMTTGVIALVGIHATMSNSTASDGVFASFAVSGATTIAAATPPAIYHLSPVNGHEAAWGAAWAITLTAGSNVFKMQYRRFIGGTASFSTRYIWGIPAGAA